MPKRKLASLHSGSGLQEFGWFDPLPLAMLRIVEDGMW